MHQQSLAELQDVLTQRITQGKPLRGSRLSGWSKYCGICLPRGAPMRAWWLLMLAALVVPGAWSSLTEEQEELLVELHNHYRGQVSPSASAMLPLKWDMSLKLVAQNYAAKCIWNHNPELQDTGENLFAGTGPLDLREALEKWFLEHLDYDYQNDSCDEDKMCGHYTQMVWSGTHRVGCAIHLCSTLEGLGWEKANFLVCNYYPPGNFDKQRPYEEGDWCSRCPENLLKCENNLCVPDNVEEDDEDVGGDATWGTIVPPPATSDPSLHLEEIVAEEEEPNVAPTITADVQPAHITTTTTSTWDNKDTTLPPTPYFSTLPPNVHSTTLGEEAKEEETKKETKIEKNEKRERDAVQKTRNFQTTTSAGSVSSHSLLASLTGFLILRL